MDTAAIRKEMERDGERDGKRWKEKGNYKSVRLFLSFLYTAVKSQT
jgi:hypothetical protein